MSIYQTNASSDNLTNKTTGIGEDGDILHSENLDLEEFNCLTDKKCDHSSSLATPSVVSIIKYTNDSDSNIDNEMVLENSEGSEPSISPSFTPDSPFYINGLNQSETNDTENDTDISYLKNSSKDPNDDSISSPLTNGFYYNIRQECNGEYIEKSKFFITVLSYSKLIDLCS